MRKKSLTCVCLILLISMLVLPVAGFAGDAATISGEKTEANSGEHVDYTVSISNNTGLAGFMVYVYCDTSVFELINDQATLGNFTSSGSIFTNADGTNGWKILWFNAQNVNGNGSLFTLELSISSNAKAGTYPIKISLSPENTVNASGELVDVTCIDGSISVVNDAYEPGGDDNPVASPEPTQPVEGAGDGQESDDKTDNSDNKGDESATITQQFKDVPSTHWAYEFVNLLSSKGVIDGVGDGLFDPNGKVTRAQFVKMLAGVLGVAPTETVSVFKDVPADAWYSGYVAWAYANEITGGVDDEHFAPDAGVTREQICTLIARAADKYGIDLPIKETEISFIDEASISPYASDSIVKMQRAGIISGYEDGSFRPQNGATRAEAAKLLCGLLDLLKG